MPPKRAKTAEQWVKEYPEDLIITSKDVHLENGKKKKIETLSCKFCANEFLFNSHIPNRLKNTFLVQRFTAKRRK
jgi:hypothetical protein